MLDFLGGFLTAVQLDVPEVLAVQIGMKAIISIVQHGRFGIPTEGSLGLGNLAECRRKLDQRAAVVWFIGPEAS